MSATKVLVTVDRLAPCHTHAYSLVWNGNTRLSGKQVAAVIVHVVVVLDEVVPTATSLGQQPVARRVRGGSLQLAGRVPSPGLWWVFVGRSLAQAEGRGEGVAEFIILPGGEQDSQHISKGALERYDVPRLTERYTFLSERAKKKKNAPAHCGRGPVAFTTTVGDEAKVRRETKVAVEMAYMLQTRLELLDGERKGEACVTKALSVIGARMSSEGGRTKLGRRIVAQACDKWVNEERQQTDDELDLV
ncbi:hypothetical protein EDB86DRAFT_2830268 [Lactarius hatsudake]|nr:hypothetical protein EDB86DRAFT_2830268 [Lactarius hatsudake]